MWLGVREWRLHTLWTGRNEAVETCGGWYERLEQRLVRRDRRERPAGKNLLRRWKHACLLILQMLAHRNRRWAHSEA